MNLHEIYDMWQNNIEFRIAFKKDPEKALRDSGYEVTKEDLEKIKSMLKLNDDSSQSEDLDPRQLT